MDANSPERVVVALTGAPSGERLIRRAAKIAQGQGADLLGVHIRGGDEHAGASEVLERYRTVLAEVGGVYHEIVADDAGAGLVAFAQAEGATHLVLGASRRSSWTAITRGSLINSVIRNAGVIDVHVVGGTEPELASAIPPPRRSASPLSRRRRSFGWTTALAGTLALTLAFASTRDLFSEGSRLLVYLVLVLMAAAVGGTGPAVAAAVLSAAAINWYFTPPLYRWTIADVEDVLALVIFVAAGLGVGLLVTQMARRSADAARARAEAEVLARAAASVAGGDDPLPSILETLCTALDLEGVSLLTQGADGYHVLTAVGPEAPRHVNEATLRLDLPDRTVLALRGSLHTDEGRVLRVFADQLAAALERQALREEAARAQALAAADALRTALLRAVSHDLRTPLASIKASVSSLLQGDVRWSAAVEKEFLTAIDEETDRLNRLVGNLLDMSRLQAGAVVPEPEPVALDDVVATALADLTGHFEVDIPDDIPLALADAALLERSLANLITNAAEVSQGQTVRIEARRHAPGVALRVVDSGPGIPIEDRAAVFEPFHRGGDRGDGGVGLGLAVARGLVTAMGGTITALDTPGGGLTMEIHLPATEVPYER
ncbi:MAG: DUF4118 domain-containing protein [Actinobacteria bacterium]|nr:DUF4118 domain-containing protein [Actinomycetota bacterium]